MAKYNMMSALKVKADSLSLSSAVANKDANPEGVR